MAVLDSLMGITAEILIRGNPAPEIPDEDDVQVSHNDPAIQRLQAARTVSSYIESETNVPFSIRVFVGPPYKIDCAKLAFHIFVDGKPGWVSICDRPFFAKRANTVWEHKVTGIKEGKGRGCTERGFRFAKIETNDNELDFMTMNRKIQRMRSVGLIEIRVYRSDYGRVGGPTEASFNDFPEAKGKDVPEKALKGDPKSHNAVLANRSKVARGPVFRLKKKDGEDLPIVIFKFMYRSQEALKEMHIIERTLSPSPSLGLYFPREPSPTPSELQEAAKIVRRRRIEEANIRRTAGSKNRSGAVKREHEAVERGRSSSRSGSYRPAKRARGETILEPIDLAGETDEDDEDGLFVKG